MRGIRAFRCRAISMRRRGRIPRASSSAIARASKRCWRSVARAAPNDTQAASLIDGVAREGHARAVLSPIDGKTIGHVSEADEAIAHDALAAAAKGFAAWAARRSRSAPPRSNGPPISTSANRDALLALLQREGGKTLDDALAEVREAVDFCRYYARASARGAGARAHAGADRRDQRAAPSRARRVRLHQPVEFPARDLHRPDRRRAGRGQFRGRQARRADAADRGARGPADARGRHRADRRCISCSGDGKVGAALVADARVAGVAFTGSTEVARLINRALAAKDGPIVPLIAETGGINAMIVDATALPEQVTDDVITSAFRSAGQRCSALRLLCVQEDVADRIIEMIEGAARALVRRRSARDRDACRAGDRRGGKGQARPLDRRACEPRHLPPRRRAGERHLSSRRPSSRSIARAISPRRCSARCCMWCAGAPDALDRCSTTSPPMATA